MKKNHQWIYERREGRRGSRRRSWEREKEKRVRETVITCMLVWMDVKSEKSNWSVRSLALLVAEEQEGERREERSDERVRLNNTWSFKEMNMESLIHACVCYFLVTLVPTAYTAQLPIGGHVSQSFSCLIQLASGWLEEEQGWGENVSALGEAKMVPATAAAAVAVACFWCIKALFSASSSLTRASSCCTRFSNSSTWSEKRRGEERRGEEKRKRHDKSYIHSRYSLSRKEKGKKMR